VVGTSVTGTTKTVTGQKAVTVAPSQPLATGDKVSYSVNSKPVGSVTIGAENKDPSLPVDFGNEMNGSAQITANIDRTDGSSETYGVKTKVDNSKVATTQSWFARTGVRLIATTISIVLAFVGGVLIFRAIKQRREYAEMHNLDSYQYVQPQSDVGAYSLPPLAVLVFAAGAVFASLTGAETVRVGVVADLTKASLPTEYSLVTAAEGNYIQMRSLEHTMPTPTPPTTPTTPPTTPTTPTTPTPPSPPVDTASYAANLAMLKSLPDRNTNEDNSPYKNTPSDQLFDKADLYTSYTDYMTENGSYWGEYWYDLAFFRTTAAGSFRAACEVSHFGYDDPIVYPGQPGAAHLHMFIGNTDTNAYSTYDTILNSGGSTCNGGELNRTAYWVPAMFDGKGNIVAPTRIGFYYKTEGTAGIGKVPYYPEGLRMIADRHNNTQGNLDASTFRCNNMFNGAKSDPSATIPTCFSPPKNGAFVGALEMLIQFDYCWNGKTDTIDDWEANSGKNGKVPNIVPPNGSWFGNNCPATHPKVLPNLVTHIFYDIKLGEDTSTWFLSSDVDRATGALTSAGRGASAHADWFGGWNKQVNKEWVDNCSNIQNAECGAGLLADPNNKPNPKALRLRHDWIAGVNNPKARIPVTEIYQYLCPGGKPIDTTGAAAPAAYCQK
jgi:hypothetical protein